MEAKYIESQANRLQELWVSRDNMIKKDRELIRLVEPVKREGFTSVTKNEPKVLFDTSVALLSGFIPRVRIPLSTQGDEEKDRMNKAERFLIGILRELERKYQDRGRVSFLRELSYQICGGWYCALPVVEAIDGQVEFDCVLYDPITVYPEWGPRALSKVARVYFTSKEQAELMAEEAGWSFSPAAGNEVKVVNFYETRRRKTQHAILLGGQVMFQETLDFMPLRIGAVGGAPYGAQFNGDSQWAGYFGESIVGANRGEFAQINKWLSLMMQIVQDTAYPPIVSKTQTGDLQLKPEDMGSGIHIPLRLEEQLETFKHAGSPVEVNQILSMLSGDIQRGGLPYVVYGGLPFEVSGFALSQLMSAVKYKLNPYMTAYTSIISRLLQDFMHLYKTAGLKKITLTTENPKRVGKGETFMEEFSPKDLPEVRFVEVSSEIALPTDKTQQILMARQALNPPAIMSLETLWDEVLDIQDSKMERERMLDDVVLQSPIMQSIVISERIQEKANAMRAAGNEAGAAIAEQYANMVLQQAQQQVAPQGVQPEAMPPEMQTGGAMDMLKARLGKVPTGEGGLPKRM